MTNRIREILERNYVEASAPCRIDMGGTLDLSTFYIPLRRYSPCTFNIALGLKTTVRIEAYEKGATQVISSGFKKCRFSLERAPFNHPLGLMFAIANYFEADGVQIIIESSSPPRSALGGSSAAAVALVAAFSKAVEATGGMQRSKKNIALLAHALEGSVAGVPCGLQDHLAAVFGGAHAWFWPGSLEDSAYRKVRVIPSRVFNQVKNHLLVAYCGVPHESKNSNNQWVKQFLAGKHRREWVEICYYTQKFVDAMGDLNYKTAADCMNKEVALRSAMTPWVLDSMGKKLAAAAAENECGARFAGAGGGGCVWALGEIENIDTLRRIWENILKRRKDAFVLDSRIDRKGVTVQITNHSIKLKGST
jgi:D-glycero-alpha-D-manno-heptose-7-phosphate kinase